MKKNVLRFSSSKNVKTFTPKWQTEQFILHLTTQHAEKWKEHELLKDKSTFFGPPTESAETVTDYFEAELSVVYSVTKPIVDVIIMSLLCDDDHRSGHLFHETDDEYEIRVQKSKLFGLVT